jgi:hypothetical protein
MPGAILMASMPFIGPPPNIAAGIDLHSRAATDQTHVHEQGGRNIVMVGGCWPVVKVDQASNPSSMRAHPKPIAPGVEPVGMPACWYIAAVMPGHPGCCIPCAGAAWGCCCAACIAAGGCAPGAVPSVLLMWHRSASPSHIMRETCAVPPAHQHEQVGAGVGTMTMTLTSAAFQLSEHGGGASAAPTGRQQRQHVACTETGVAYGLLQVCSASHGTAHPQVLQPCPAATFKAWKPQAAPAGVQSPQVRCSGATAGCSKSVPSGSQLCSVFGASTHPQCWRPGQWPRQHWLTAFTARSTEERRDVPWTAGQVLARRQRSVWCRATRWPLPRSNTPRRPSNHSAAVESLPRSHAVGGPKVLQDTLP